MTTTRVKSSEYHSAALRRMVAFLSLACLAFGSSAAAESELRFDRPAIDLGRVEAVGEIDQSFPFEVVGNQPVDILEIRGSCGCLTPYLPKRRYLPGEKDIVRLKIHATSQQEGKRHYQVTLVTRADRVKTIVLSVDLDLYKPIVVEPSHLLLYPSGSRSLNQTLTIRDQRPRPLRLGNVQATSERLIPRVKRPATEDDAVRQVDLVVANDFPIGKSEEKIVIQTGDPEHPQLVVPVTIIRASRIRVLPERLTAPLSRSRGRSPSWQVLLSDARREPIRIASVECRDPRVRVEFPQESTARSRLHVSLSEEKMSEPIDAEIVIHVVEPIETDLYLPVQVE